MSKRYLRRNPGWASGPIEYLEVDEDYSIPNNYRYIDLYTDPQQSVARYQVEGHQAYPRDQYVGEISEAQFNALFALYYKESEL